MPAGRRRPRLDSRVSAPVRNDGGVKLRSSHELLIWLVELGEIRAGSGALKRGDHLLTQATSEGKIGEPPNQLGEWLYELRDRGSIVFNDADIAPGRGADDRFSRNDVSLLRNFSVTAAGRASVNSAPPPLT